MPNFDEDRVYHSDVKKLVQWYNSMQAKGLIKLEEKVAVKKASAKKKAPAKKKVAVKKTDK